MQKYEKWCPIFNAHDKYEESIFFLANMVAYYHSSRLFRFYLNAFIKSFREITFMIQTYKNSILNFDAWYKIKREEMKNDRFLRWLSDSRTRVVHRDMLKTKSNIAVGLFRGRTLKLAFSIPINNPFVDSSYFLKMANSFEFIDKSHSAIGEQCGVRRQWKCDGLAEGDELVKVCIYGLDYIGELLVELHKMFGFSFKPYTFDKNEIEEKYVLLETDIDPRLVKKWGWE